LNNTAILVSRKDWRASHPEAEKSRNKKEYDRVSSDPELKAKEAARLAALVKANGGKNQKAWKARNKDAYAEYQKQYNADYRERPSFEDWWRAYRAKQWLDPAFRAKRSADQAARLANQNGNGGRYLPEQFDLLCHVYGDVCLRCMTSESRLTADHVVPVSKPGGTSWITNIQPLCGSCNSSKGDKTIDFRPFPVPTEIVSLLQA
jgi:5-methylcytosine-specific restriction endonuclease McrA